MQSPGIVNFPVFFTSVVASVTRLSMTSPTAFLSTPLLSATADVMPLFGIAVTAFFFMAFMAFIAFTIAEKSSEEVLK